MDSKILSILCLVSVSWIAPLPSQAISSDFEIAPELDFQCAKDAIIESLMADGYVMDDDRPTMVNLSTGLYPTFLRLFGIRVFRQLSFDFYPDRGSFTVYMLNVSDGGLEPLIGQNLRAILDNALEAPKQRCEAQGT